TDMFIRSTLYIICYLMIWDAFGQNQIGGHLRAKDSIEFSIINVLPDSFPTVSIILRVIKPNGDPIWNVKKGDFSVSENGEDSDVKSLTPISRNKPINVGIVLDHSGSMLEDYSLLYDKNGMELFS